MNHTFGQHHIRGGFEYQERTTTSVIYLTGYQAASYCVLGSSLSGLTAGELPGAAIQGTEFDPTNASDLQRLHRDHRCQRGPLAFYAAYDPNGDGTISQDELASMVHNTTAGNPHGAVNYDRTEQTPMASRRRARTA